MIRIQFRITFDWIMKVVILSSLLLSLLAFDWPASPAVLSVEQVQNEAAFIPRDTGKRHFYLTNTSYATNQALNACSSGYHMASIWEILEVSNLTYDYDHPAAYTKADSGYGPPSSWYGQVRTGYNSSGSSTTGSGNCYNWSSSNSSIYGVSIRLSNTWETVHGDIATWDATSFPCNYSGPVWCAGSFQFTYMPFIRR